MSHIVGIVATTSCIVILFVSSLSARIPKRLLFRRTNNIHSRFDTTLQWVWLCQTLHKTFIQLFSFFRCVTSYIHCVAHFHKTAEQSQDNSNVTHKKRFHSRELRPAVWSLSNFVCDILEKQTIINSFHSRMKWDEEVVSISNHFGMCVFTLYRIIFENPPIWCWMIIAFINETMRI